MVEIGEAVQGAVRAQRLVAGDALLALVAGAVDISPADRVALFEPRHGGANFLEPDLVAGLRRGLETLYLDDASALMAYDHVIVPLVLIGPADP